MSGPGDLRLLPARSVVLSLLLGTHPDRLTARQLIRAGEHFGIAPATLRVALTRAVAAQDLRRDGSDYALGQRLVARQGRQDEAVEDAGEPWSGDWEIAVVTVTGRTPQERAALRDTLGRARLAELREGVWSRPANLRRPASYRSDPALSSFRARPEGDPAELAAGLWDLTSWATTGTHLLHRLAQSDVPAERLAVAATIVRHLTTDPLLPPVLCPTHWPGSLLRAAYADYQRELRTAAELG